MESNESVGEKHKSNFMNALRTSFKQLIEQKKINNTL